MSNAAICEEITRTQIIMEKITGRSGVLFRPPFGKTDDRVAQIAADAGLRTVLWDVATDDYAPRDSRRRYKANGVDGRAQRLDCAAAYEWRIEGHRRRCRILWRN